MKRAKTVLLKTITVRLKKYANTQGFIFLQYNNKLHVRISSPNVNLDVWPSTGKYYIQSTNFAYTGVIERQGEKGYLPASEDQLTDFLDKLFFAVDFL